MTRISRFLAAAAMAFSAGAAAAATVPSSYESTQRILNFCEGGTFCSDAGGALTMTFEPGEVQAVSDGVLELAFFGDFDGVNETISVSLGELALGEVMDNDPTNDIFDGPSGGNQYSEPVWLFGSVGMDALNSQLKDGKLTLRFSTLISDTGNSFNGVDDFAGLEGMQAVMKFTTIPAPVPLPAGAVLLFSGLVGLGVVRRRRG